MAESTWREQLDSIRASVAAIAKVSLPADSPIGFALEQELRPIATSMRLAEVRAAEVARNHAQRVKAAAEQAQREKEAAEALEEARKAELARQAKEQAERESRAATTTE